MPKKLLLADDSVTIQKVISITFASEDYELVVVGDGDSALSKAKEFAPDLILADVVMPGKNGYELCEAVKTDQVLNSIPVILLAGTFEPLDKEEAARVKADDSIVKPFESQELIDKVDALLASTLLSREAASPESVFEVPENYFSTDDMPDLEETKETGSDLDFLEGGIFEEPVEKSDTTFAGLESLDEELTSSGTDADIGDVLSFEPGPGSAEPLEVEHLGADAEPFRTEPEPFDTTADGAVEASLVGAPEDKVDFGVSEVEFESNVSELIAEPRDGLGIEEESTQSFEEPVEEPIEEADLESVPELITELREGLGIEEESIQPVEEPIEEAGLEPVPELIIETREGFGNEDITEPAEEPVEEPTEEAGLESVPELIIETREGFGIEDIAEPAEESVEEPIEEAGLESVPELIIETREGFGIEDITEPAEESVPELITESSDDFGIEDIAEPVAEAEGAEELLESLNDETVEVAQEPELIEQSQELQIEEAEIVSEHEPAELYEAALEELDTSQTESSDNSSTVESVRETSTEAVFERSVAEVASATAGITENLPADKVEEIVERVAREVVEKVAWEVVPELAEELINAQIEKFKAIMMQPK